MPSFKDSLEPADVEKIKHYVMSQEYAAYLKAQQPVAAKATP